MSLLILNLDSSHFFFTREAETVDEEAIHAFVDQYIGTQVDEIRFNVNAMTASFDSRIFDPVWKEFDPLRGLDQPCLAVLPDLEERRLVGNLMKCARRLALDGGNVFKTWMARSRRNGISPWISTRMNDVHGVENEAHPLHGTFWKIHPEYRRAPYHDTAWTDKALDFGRQEVRDRHFAFIRELAEQFDMDGLELDWMRFGLHFRPGYEEEGVGQLTRFTADVRSLLDDWQSRRGHRIELAARVPSRPATALALGFDAVDWARKGLVSRLVITPFWVTSETDMPIELWKQLLDGTGVRLEAGFELLIRPHPESRPFQTNSLETVRGAALSHLSRGADAVYLYNYFDQLTCMDDLENYPTLLNEAGSMETMRRKARRHVVTYPDFPGIGEGLTHLLPVVLEKDTCSAFRIPIGERPDGQAARVVVGFVAKSGTHELRRLWVNGILCSEDPLFRVGKPAPDSVAIAYRIPEGSLHDGFNMVEMFGYEGTVDWMEIDIRSFNSTSPP